MTQDDKPTPLGLRHLAFVVVTILLVAMGWFIFYSPGWIRPVAESASTPVGTNKVD